MSSHILLPALQGRFGAWTYYAAIMRVSEVEKRVQFARELHPNESLSNRIQRELQDSGPGGRNRAVAIANYLRDNDRRFFNSIVVGTYGGEPVWHPFKVVPRSVRDETIDIQRSEEDRVGFLELAGTERLFALDGQHRVAGIRNAVQAAVEIGDDILTVLFVPHSNDDAGVARTRRLFVDLNKRAIPVARKDIIILDEIDLPAILSRRLVDDHPWFSKGQIDVDRFNNTIPQTTKALCSIGTLYDVIRRVLPKALARTRDERDELKEAANLRLPDDRIDYYYLRSLTYFEGLAHANRRLRDYFERGATSDIAVAARSLEERNVLFRPVGQQLYANVIAALAESEGLERALEVARLFPVDMAEPPYADVIWDTRRHMMRGKGLGLATRLLKYMCGAGQEKDLNDLQREYRLLLGHERATLPERIVSS